MSQSSEGGKLPLRMPVSALRARVRTENLRAAIRRSHAFVVAGDGQPQLPAFVREHLWREPGAGRQVVSVQRQASTGALHGG